MAQLLAEGLAKFPEISLSQPVESNAVFVSLPKSQIDQLQKNHSFALWNAEKNEIRLVTSFDTAKEDIATFLADVQKSFS
ncbi:hypothetical protein [Planococcus sp. ISL-110]|uniref:hypothetical protein n=1 Tax=Planococcus sp. ISL-110 TaxID=2819167 RepID=UPI001BE70784|nr:hypothetical protein [Planococcus sp. ISL-110]MBT2571328.1 hypothetical protein [Planococcus sp. ISL-110]